MGRKEVSKMLLAHIAFRRMDGSWGHIVRSQFSLLIHWIKEGAVDALTADSISVEEAEILRQASFSLIPDEIVVGIGPARRTHKILRIEKS